MNSGTPKAAEDIIGQRKISWLTLLGSAGVLLIVVALFVSIAIDQQVTLIDGGAAVTAGGLTLFANSLWKRWVS